MARSHDLEIELSAGKTRPVSEQEVIASYHREERYLTAPVLRAVFAAPIRSPISSSV
jgi:hypothetical protein